MIKNVVLDYGHGGIDEDGNYTTAPNKMHTFEDGTVVCEGVINRQIGQQIADCLRDYKEINVIETVDHDDPLDPSLRDRVGVANDFPPESTIFVSVHCNASSNHNAGGFEIWTSMGNTASDELAKEVQSSCKHVLKNWELKDRGLKESNFYVLRKTACTAILIECGFFDFREDFDKLKDTLFQGDLGSFIATGILNYINGKNKQQNPIS